MKHIKYDMHKVYMYIYKVTHTYVYMFITILMLILLCFQTSFICIFIVKKFAELNIGNQLNLWIAN